MDEYRGDKLDRFFINMVYAVAKSLSVAFLIVSKSLSILKWPLIGFCVLLMFLKMFVHP